MAASSRPPPPPINGARPSRRNQKRGKNNKEQEKNLEPPSSLETEVHSTAALSDERVTDDTNRDEDELPLQHVAASTTEEDVSNLTTRLSECEEAVTRLKTELQERDDTIEQLKRQSSAEKEELQLVIAQRDEQLAELEAQVKASDAANVELASVQQDLAQLRTQVSERDEQVDKLSRQLDASVRQDADDKHWEQEREQLEARLEEEKNRADCAEDCVRNLRYTNEESRRAIMRLQSMRSSSQRSDDDGADRRRSGHILSSLSGRSDADSETDRSGLRDLRLVSPSQPSQEQFSPPMRPDEPATDDVSSQHGDDTVSTTTPAIAGFFPSSLLRSSLGFSRKGPGDEASGADLSMEEMRVEHEKTQKELRAVQQELAQVHAQLFESREAEQASQTMISSLRAYIAEGQATP